MLETFRALAEPSRLQIVELLAAGPLPVGAVSERLGIRQPQASKHLHVLSEAGLVEVRPAAQQRIYALRAQALGELEAWLQRYRRRVEGQFERLDEVLEHLKEREQTANQDKKRTRRGRAKPKPR
jgi:DNA-binding transcriptional ArsR family regulator